MKYDNLEREKEFIERIEQLDSGKLAMLRRGCGERDAIAGKCPWFYGVLQGIGDETTSYLVASLMAQYSTAKVKSGSHRAEGDFGSTWKKAITASGSESLQRRFLILLDSDYNSYTGEGDLPYRLRQMVRYVAHMRLGINWPRLFDDIKQWNHPDKHVQKRWARSFYGNQHQDDAANKEEE